MTAIYALCEPESGEVRYVGKADNPTARLSQHLAPTQCAPDTYKNRWLRRLLRTGSRPTLRILQWVAEEEWAAAEQYWIAAFRDRGARLTNATGGGEGLVDISGETRQKLRLARANRRVSPTKPVPNGPAAIRWDPVRQRWAAGIILHGEEQVVGHFHDPADALMALEALAGRLDLPLGSPREKSLAL